MAGWGLTHSPSQGSCSLLCAHPSRRPTLCQQTSPPGFGHPLGRSCNEWLTQPSAGSCPLLFCFRQTLPTKPMSCPVLGKSPASSLHAGDALPEQDGEGRGRDKQCRANLEGPTTKFSQKSTKLPEQSPRRTHLHIGVALAALCSHQTFCFHDWKGNEMVTGQSSIFLPHTAHRVIPPCGAEPSGHPQTGAGVHCSVPLTHPGYKYSLR